MYAHKIKDNSSRERCLRPEKIVCDGGSMDYFPRAILYELGSLLSCTSAVKSTSAHLLLL